MANCNDIINNQLTMGRSRLLCYAVNVERRRRKNGEEERRLGLIPPAGRGIRPVVLRALGRAPGGKYLFKQYSKREK